MSATPKVEIFEDEERLHQRAAEYFINAAAESIEARHLFLAALTGGHTPRGFYRLLATEPHLGHVPWSAVHFFWGDERLVAPDHPESNFRMAKELLLDQVAAKPDNIHRIKGELSPAAAVTDYRQQLLAYATAGESCPRFDLIVFGLGNDGHIASLPAGRMSAAETEQPVLATEMGYQGRPSSRVTLTPLLFNRARRILFLVTGADKAEAVAATLAGDLDPVKWPGQRVRPEEGEVIWLLDLAAAAGLRAIKSKEEEHG